MNKLLLIGISAVFGYLLGREIDRHIEKAEKNRSNKEWNDQLNKIFGKNNVVNLKGYDKNSDN